MRHGAEPSSGDLEEGVCETRKKGRWGGDVSNCLVCADESNDGGKWDMRDVLAQPKGGEGQGARSNGSTLIRGFAMVAYWKKKIQSIHLFTFGLKTACANE